MGMLGSTPSPNPGINIVRRRQAEMKASSVSAATMGMTAVGSTAVFYNFPSLIATGTDMASRIGRLMQVTRVALDGVLLGGQTNSVADDAYNVVRVSVVEGEPALSVASPNHPGLLGPWDPRVQVGLMDVLFDRTYVLQAPAKDSTGYIAAACPCQFDLRMSKVLEYTGSSAASPRNRTLYLVIISDSVAVVNPGLSASSTLTFQWLDA